VGTLRYDPDVPTKLAEVGRDLANLESRALKRIATKGGRVLDYQLRSTNVTTTATTQSGAATVHQSEPVEVKTDRFYRVECPNFSCFQVGGMTSVGIINAVITYTEDGSEPTSTDPYLVLTGCVTPSDNLVVTNGVCGFYFASANVTFRAGLFFWRGVTGGGTSGGVFGASFIELVIMDTGLDAQTA